MWIFGEIYNCLNAAMNYTSQKIETKWWRERAKFIKLGIWSGWKTNFQNHFDIISRVMNSHFIPVNWFTTRISVMHKGNVISPINHQWSKNRSQIHVRIDINTRSQLRDGGERIQTNCSWSVVSLRLHDIDYIWGFVGDGLTLFLMSSRNNAKIKPQYDRRREKWSDDLFYIHIQVFLVNVVAGLLSLAYLQTEFVPDEGWQSLEVAYQVYFGYDAFKLSSPDWIRSLEQPERSFQAPICSPLL